MHLPNTRISDKFFLFSAVGVALFALIMHVGIAQTNLPPNAWHVAAQQIRTQYQKGDAIALLPAWALRGAEPLKDLPVLYAKYIEKEDLSRYKRLWVLAAPRLGKWWFQHAFSAQIKALKQRFWLQKKYIFAQDPKTKQKTFILRKDGKGFSRLEVYLFKLPPAQPMVYDFSAKRNLRKAEVTLETPDPHKRVGRCRRTQSGAQWMRSWQEQPGWFRGRGAYFFGRITQEIRNTPRDCLYAQPQTCKVLKVRYRNVPLHGQLTLEHGFTTPAPGKVTATVPPVGPDVVLSIWVENRKLKTFRVAQKDIWRKAWINLDAYTWPRTKGSVEFRIHTPAYQHHRVGYCFRSTLRKR